MKNIKRFEKRVYLILNREFHVCITSSYKNKKVTVSFDDNSFSCIADTFNEAFEGMFETLMQYRLQGFLLGGDFK